MYMFFKYNLHNQLNSFWAWIWYVCRIMFAVVQSHQMFNSSLNLFTNAFYDVNFLKPLNALFQNNPTFHLAERNIIHYYLLIKCLLTLSSQLLSDHYYANLFSARSLQHVIKLSLMQLQISGTVQLILMYSNTATFKISCSDVLYNG